MMFVWINKQGLYLRFSVSHTHTGTHSRYKWVSNINDASVSLELPRALKGLDVRRLAAKEEVRVSLVEPGDSNWEAALAPQAQPKQDVEELKTAFNALVETCGDAEKFSKDLTYRLGCFAYFVHGTQFIKAQPAQEPESKGVCTNCVGTGIEIGVYQNRPCGFCDEKWSLNESSR